MGGPFPSPSDVRPHPTVIDSQSVGIVGEDTASFDPAMSDTKYGCFFSMTMPHLVFWSMRSAWIRGPSRLPAYGI